MRKKNPNNGILPPKGREIVIQKIKAVKLGEGSVPGGNLSLAEYRQLKPEAREVLLERTLGGLLSSRAGLADKLQDLLDKLRYHALTLISVTPASGGVGDTVKVLAQLGGYAAADCRVYFSSPLSGRQAGAITNSKNLGVGQSELSVTVPDFPGATGNLSLSISLEHLHWYTVSSHDLNTPPTHFSVVDATSNAIPFTWEPSAPIIEEYWANWQTGTFQVSPGTSIQLLWRVRNVTEITISRASNVGPAPAIHEVFPTVQGFVENWRDIGKFLGDTPRQETYIITATNPWGSATASVCVQLRVKPFIRIIGAEVVQAIQHFTLAPTVTLPLGVTIPSSVYNNSIGLIARKKTIVRLYVDSGMSGGFKNGAGPDEQPNLTGKITLTLADGSKRTATTIRNSTGRLTARPQGSMDRKDFEHTLNIELPWDCLAGQIKMDARVWVSADVDGVNHSGDLSYSGYAYDKGLGSFGFMARRQLRLVRILVRDDHLGLAAPSTASYWESVEGLLARYPVAHDGVEVSIPQATGDDVYETSCNLATIDGWEDLIDDIEEVADAYVSGDQYWTAVVPDDSRYALNGISQSSWAFDTNPHPCLVARAGLRATFPHELGHNLGFGHSDCGDPAGVDDDLPAHTDELGLDVELGELIPAGFGDLMSYCTHHDYQKRWPTITLWTKLIDKLAP